MSLRQKIEQGIAARGSIPFSRYMDLCLYDPEFGYYSRNPEQFGKAGDFYTSSDVHAVFGRLMARQFEEIWCLLEKPPQIEILELGPGRGSFAQDVLDWSEKKFPEFFSALHYSLAEKSPMLRSRLQQTLVRHFDRGRVSLTGNRPPVLGEEEGNGATSVVLNQPLLTRALATEVPLIVFANEFFDALPVEIVSSQGSLYLGKTLAETWMPASADELEFLDRYSVHPEPGERLEVPLMAERYASATASVIQRGFLIAIDYGYTREEQLAGRHRGTLMTYRHHSSGINPYQAPGEEDITAHVNFTALAGEFAKHGLSPETLLTQSQFLLGIGESNQFADVFEECRLPQERAKAALQLKHLITPTGMGESFQVLVASKGVDPAEVSRLAGLSFGRARRD